MKDKIEKTNNSKMTQTYISGELTHFTKKYETLRAILNDGILLGGPNIEISRKGAIEYESRYKRNMSENAMIKVNKVCFSDIPKGQMDIHKQKYGYYGILFDKDFIVRKGGIPVHYVPLEASINSRWANAGETRASFFDRMTKEMYEYFDNLIVKYFHDEEKRKNIKDFTSLLKYISSHIINSLTIRCQM